MERNDVERSGSAGSGEGPRFVVCKHCDGSGKVFVGTTGCDDTEWEPCPDCGGPDCAPGVRDTRPSPVVSSEPETPVVSSEGGGSGDVSDVTRAEEESAQAAWVRAMNNGEPRLVSMRAALRAAYAERDRARGEGQSEAFPREAWHEDDGPALWWKFPVCEPPYSGTPLDDDFPDYVTHWTRVVVPQAPGVKA